MDYSEPLALQDEELHRKRRMAFAQEQNGHVMTSWYMHSYPAPRSFCTRCRASLYWTGDGTAIAYRCGEMPAAWPVRLWNRLTGR